MFRSCLAASHRLLSGLQWHSILQLNFRGLCFWQSWTFCHSSKSVFGKTFAGYRTVLSKSIYNPNLLVSENNPVTPSLETASLAAISFIISRLICWLTLWWKTQKISRPVVLKLVLSAFPCHIFCLFWESPVPTIANGRQITAVNALLLHGATVDRQVGRWTGKRRQKHISWQLGAGSFTTNLWHPAASWDRGARFVLFFSQKNGEGGGVFWKLRDGNDAFLCFCCCFLFSFGLFWCVSYNAGCIWCGKMEGHITSHSLVSMPRHGWLRTNSWQLWIVESVLHSWRWLRTKACRSVELAELWNSLKDMNSVHGGLSPAKQLL